MHARTFAQAGWHRVRTLAALALALVLGDALAEPPQPAAAPVYEVRPIGWIRKADGRTSIVLDHRYRPGLRGVEALASIWVLYWFDRNDTAEQRATLQVHPRGDPANPLRGVFATRAPVRPNLIALSRCRVLAVHDDVVEIDALPDTAVLDIKPYGTARAAVSRCESPAAHPRALRTPPPSQRERLRLSKHTSARIRPCPHPTGGPPWPDPE